MTCCECAAADEILLATSSLLRRDFDRPNTFAVRFSLVQFGSLWSQSRSKSRSVHWFNMASVDIINFENKLLLGHVKVTLGNGYAFGLELGKRILPVCDRYRGTDVPARADELVVGDGVGWSYDRRRRRAAHFSSAAAAWLYGRRRRRRRRQTG